MLKNILDWIWVTIKVILGLAYLIAIPFIDIFIGFL